MITLQEADLDRVSEALYLMLKGKTASPIVLPPDYPENELKQVVCYLNTLIAQYHEFAGFLDILSRGDLDFQPPRGRMAVLQSFKNLHANLRHLTWKTQQIAGGDLSQQVDFMGDFSVAFNTMTQQLHDAFERIERQKNELAEAYAVIKEEKDKSDRLLLNVLPVAVANDLKKTGQTTPELFEDVTVLFSDLVGFTRYSSELDPAELIDELNDLFTAFDTIVEANQCERIKTIGDAYLAVCGMPHPNERHAQHVVDAALQFVAYLKERNARSAHSWRARIGVHSGRVVGGVVGVKKYIYDVFGDTINTASRMESHSEAMRVNLSEATQSLLPDGYRFIEREATEVKGKGRMNMYFVESASGQDL